MTRFNDDNRIKESKNFAVKYVNWMFTGKYIRFLKILYTCIWITALATFNFDAFVALAGGGFLVSEVYKLIFRDDYDKEDSVLIQLGNG